jgi:TPR repeat protein
MYENGQGVPQDYVQAHMWFNLAAASSVAENAKEGVEGRDRVAGKMTAEQIAEAQRLSQREAAGGPGTFELHVTNVRSLEHDRRVGFSKALVVYAVSAYGPKVSYVLYCVKVAPRAGQVYEAVDEYLDSSWLRLWPVERSTLPSGTKQRGRVFRVITLRGAGESAKFPDLACDISSETARQ